MKPHLIVFGSCQAQELANLARCFPAITLKYEVVYLASFPMPPANKLPTLPEKVVESCSILWEQFDNSNPFPHHDILPASAQRLMFPGIDMNCLWPFNSRDPLNAPEPNLPFGRFPYGDRLIISLMNQGLSREAVLQAYDDKAWEAKDQLARLFEIDMVRQDQREAKCDITFRDHLVEGLRQTRTLWTHNHPTIETLKVLFGRLSAATWENRIPDWERELASFPDPYAYLQMPVHAVVAEAFSLSWWRPDYEYVLPGYGPMTYDDYLRAYVDWRFERQA